MVDTTISTLANVVYADGPVATPTEPDKAEIRPLFGVVETRINAVEAQSLAIAAGVNFKPSARVATATSGTWATSFANGQTVDGVVIATNDDLLILHEGNTTRLGAWVVPASGAPTVRRTDVDTSAEALNMAFTVREGAANGGKAFVIRTTDGGALTLGTSPLTASQIPSESPDVVTLGASQTLTNKTHTSPVINTGDINTPDIDGGTVDGVTSLGRRSSGSAHDLAIVVDEVMTGNRNLTVRVADANRVIQLRGDIDIASGGGKALRQTDPKTGGYFDILRAEVETEDDFADWEMDLVNARAMAERQRFLDHVPTGFAPYGPGWNHALGVGQSFMAGSILGLKIILSSTTALTGTPYMAALTYRAVMLGDSDRNWKTDGTWGVIGTTQFNPLVSNFMADGVSTAYTRTQIEAGLGTGRGETPIIAACFNAEKLWNSFAQTENDTTRRFNATNAAADGALLTQIAKPSIGFSAAVASATASKARIQTEDVTSYNAGNMRLQVVFECHGQADESAGTNPATYKTDHKADFRDEVHNDIQVAVYGKGDYRALWISEQVGGVYVGDMDIAQAQLEMALDLTTHYDFIMSGPAHQDPHYFYVIAPHPWATNKHKVANGQVRGGITMSITWYWMTVLQRYWFPMHIDTSHPPIVRNRSILAGLVMIAPPAREIPSLDGLAFADFESTGFFENKGLTVRHPGGWDVPVVSVTLVRDCAVLIVCDQPLVTPQLRVGENFIYGTNFADSMTINTLGKLAAQFIDGYTDTNLSVAGYDDASELERDYVEDEPASNRLANRLVHQKISCVEASTVLKAGVSLS